MAHYFFAPWLKALLEHIDKRHVWSLAKYRHAPVWCDTTYLWYPIDFVFDSMVGFSGTADRMELLPVKLNPRWWPTLAISNHDISGTDRLLDLYLILHVGVCCQQQVNHISYQLLSWFSSVVTSLRNWKWEKVFRSSLSHWMQLFLFIRVCWCLRTVCAMAQTDGWLGFNGILGTQLVATSCLRELAQNRCRWKLILQQTFDQMQITVQLWGVTSRNKNHKNKFKYTQLLNLEGFRVAALIPVFQPDNNVWHKMTLYEWRLVLLKLTLWRPLLPYGYSYKTSCARPG